jgi:predicted Zn-dependent protease
MVQRIFRLIVLLVLVLGLASLTACSGRLALEQAVSTGMPKSDPLNGSAAESLWQMAVTAQENNQLAAAGRYLERALYMEPDSSWLYRELAELRLREGDAQSAEMMAQRSLRLAPPQPAYQSALWQLIATARLRQGDSDGAARAQAEVEKLKRR